MVRTRRDFLRAAAGSGLMLAGGCLGFPRSSGGEQKKSAGERLNIAVIGVGGRGQANWGAVCEAGERIVALCDVDESVLLACREKVAQTSPGVRLYRDFRVLFEAESGIDAVFISTPDHGHAVQAAWAMSKGCHVYMEPPLARTLGEVRFLEEKASSCGLTLQLGDQGSATGESKRAVQILESGLIGAVTEVHAWTSRPVWPQGVKRPEGSDPLPVTLDWDLWLGGAPVRPFKDKVYHRYNWRGWHDFGTGALGDAGCHLLNIPFRVLGLGAPLSVEALDVTERQAETYPKASHLQFEFKARERRRPPVTLDWYDGNWKPKAEQMPQVTAAFGQMPGSGCLLVGENGVWLVADDTGLRHYVALRGEERVVDSEKHEACAAVVAVPRGVGLQREFLDAVRGGHRDSSPRTCLIQMQESVLAGCVAQRVHGRLEWNSRKCRFDNNREANLLVAPESRKGWNLKS